MTFRGLVAQFVNELAEDPYVNQRGRLYVIIGGGTFSAATTLVTALELRTKAIFVGEPTGGLGEAYLRHGDRQRAAESYRRSLELNPGNKNARRGLKKLGV